MKPTRKAISLVFRSSENKILTTKRSLNYNFPGFWSIPSIYLQKQEKPQEAAMRLAKNQLGLKLVKISLDPIGIGVVDRENYKLRMEDYDVISYEGQFNPDQEHYTDLKWLKPQEIFDLVKKEHDGQMGECTKILFRAYGLL
jgi:ADP-ribose pyrophosphatase YjhB (NUDIX family)